MLPLQLGAFSTPQTVSLYFRGHFAAEGEKTAAKLISGLDNLVAANGCDCANLLAYYYYLYKIPRVKNKVKSKTKS